MGVFIITLRSLSEFVGVTGVIIIMIGYFLLQIGRIKAESFIYSASNLIGALFILFSIYFDWNLSSFLMEASWALISLYGVVKSLGRKTIV